MDEIEFRSNLDSELRRVGLANGLASLSIQKNWDRWRKDHPKAEWLEWAEEMMVGVVGYTAGTHRRKLNSEEGYVYFEPSAGESK